MIEYGDSVYLPIDAAGSGQVQAGQRGSIGRWVKRSDPDYDHAFEEQSRLEALWADAREEMGDG